MSETCRTHCHGHSPAPRMTRRGSLDTWAAILSSLCLVHCVAIPVAIALLPAVALVLPDIPWLHAALLSLAVPLSGLALWRGWLAHRDGLPAQVGACGLLVMAAALLATAHSVDEVLLTVGGGLLVATGHLLNLRANARSAPAIA